MAHKNALEIQMKRLVCYLFCILFVSGCSFINQPNGPELADSNTKLSQLHYPELQTTDLKTKRTPSDYRFGAPLQNTHAICPRELPATDVATMGLDSDLDGIPDRRDECPATPEQTAVDSTGCPISLFLSLTIPFESNQTTLSEIQYIRIQQLARLLKNNPQSRISLSGHTDNSGNAQDNLRISEQRAQSIKQALVEFFAIDAQRISAQGFGDSQPMVSNQTISGRERNRRVDIVLNGYYSTHTSYVALHRPYKLHFDANQTDLNTANRQQVEALGNYLRQNPEVVANINGYTDNSGNEQMNLSLSVIRAENIKQYLMENYAIGAERLQTRGYGQSNPIADNSTEAGRNLNRRVTITLAPPNTPMEPQQRFSATLAPRKSIDTISAPLARRFDNSFQASKSPTGRKLPAGRGHNRQPDALQAGDARRHRGTCVRAARNG